VVEQRPDGAHDRNFSRLVVQAIQSAEASITIENPYLIPRKEIRKALINAARRGVRIRVMTSARSTRRFKLAHDASRYYYPELLRAGIKIYEHHPMVHAKTITIDGHYVIVGSANLNGRSQMRDTEIVAALDDTKTAARLEDDFDRLLSNASELTLAQFKHNGLWAKLRSCQAAILSDNF